MNRNRQRGFTLIELLVALIIAIGVVSLAAGMLERDARRSRNDNTGEWLRIVASAARAYRNANKDALIAGAGNWAPVTVTAAQVAAYLPNGVSTTNAYGQTFQVRFVEPTTGQLDGMLITTGGDNLDGLDLVHIANAAKGGAGYVDPADTSHARGPGGNWRRGLPEFGGTPGPGKLAYALFYDDVAAVNGGASGDFLSRVDVAGKPELNRMSTAIDMANNDINNVKWVRATKGLFGSIYIGANTYGDPYPYETLGLPTGANFRFNIGGVEQLSIMNDGSINARSRVTAPNMTATGTVSANTFSGNNFNGTYVNVWDVRTGGGVYSDQLITSPRFDGNEYYANGWFRSRGSAGWYSETYGGGWHMTDSTWIRAYGGKNIHTPGEIRAGTRLSSAGEITAAGNVEGTYLKPNGRPSVGGGCAENGLIAATSSGEPLNCVSGVWTRAGGLSSAVTVTSASRSQGNYWVYATCPAGYMVSGGGHVTAYMQKASSPEGPQESRPFPEYNAWGVRSGGGANTETGVNAYAICVR
ncbi:shufflon system plasmid conjugative transfer pilus tip adhesin PilV [Pseudoxanthomonas kaohsiungensis]|uniref:Shufflon system plasmid conjugative transfer pilus tip adhesin PilV n=1 Tax=Pseudoxanthomonas kaohsiungensis TaxID=283923 RepID=A0ABW3LXK5_9GAMM|nr:shufflon system plasmid conjugative transfer pilus tip adhesin PilV [Pseudoxanthomonas kaohsiungensis]KAF1702980.1 hypothetical protein CSC66_09405 [Pseudoxanthomonas kaohsiungensis]